MHALARASLTVLLGVLSPAVGDAQHGARAALRPAIVPFLGSGGFPRPRDIESGQTAAGHLLAGASVQWPITSHALFHATAARSFQPATCPSCAPEGSLANVAILFAPGAIEAQ